MAALTATDDGARAALELLVRLRRHADAAPLAEDGAEGNFRSRALTQSLASLSFRERRVLELRYGLDGQAPATLEEVGKVFGVTRERIRQIEKTSLRKLSTLAEMKDLREVA